MKIQEKVAPVNFILKLHLLVLLVVNTTSKLATHSKLASIKNLSLGFDQGFFFGYNAGA
jgi:hypothetical protein